MAGCPGGRRAVTKVTAGEIFSSPILRITIIGILLGTIPLFGGWGVSNWAAAWASEVGDRQDATARGADPGPWTQSDPTLESRAVIYRSLPGSIASLFGGWHLPFDRSQTDLLLLCLGCFLCTQMLFRVEDTSQVNSSSRSKRSACSAASFSVGCRCAFRSCFPLEFVLPEPASASTGGVY